MDSSKSVDDDTIRDQMESGYVATRPRFTRARRTWKINVRNLVAEDMRALDEFFMVTAARGANSFLYPNLLENGSFELPADSAADLIYGWSVGAAVAQIATTTGATAYDGMQSAAFATVNGQQLGADATVLATLIADRQIACSPGEVYTFSVQAKQAVGTFAGTLSAYATATFYDSNGNQLSVYTGGAVPVASGWQSYGMQFTAPANAAGFSIALVVKLVGGAGEVTLDGSTSVLWDAAGCALLTPITPYGRMAGSQPLGCLVRFTKLPETSDIGYGAGVKRYGANFELTEV